MRDPHDEPVVEVALCQVLIDGEWVTWQRIERRKGWTWEAGFMMNLRPRTRVIMERVDATAPRTP